MVFFYLLLLVVLQLLRTLDQKVQTQASLWVYMTSITDRVKQGLPQRDVKMRRIKQTGIMMYGLVISSNGFMEINETCKYLNISVYG